MKKIDSFTFSSIKNTKYIEFTGKSIEVTTDSFTHSDNLPTVTFPNAEEINFKIDAMLSIPEKLMIHVKQSCTLSDSGLKIYKNIINYIDSKECLETEDLAAKLLKAEKEIFEAERRQ